MAKGKGSGGGGAPPPPPKPPPPPSANVAEKGAAGGYKPTAAQKQYINPKLGGVEGGIFGGGHGSGLKKPTGPPVPPGGGGGGGKKGKYKGETQKKGRRFGAPQRTGPPQGGGNILPDWMSQGINDVLLGLPQPDYGGKGYGWNKNNQPALPIGGGVGIGGAPGGIGGQPGIFDWLGGLIPTGPLPGAGGNVSAPPSPPAGGGQALGAPPHLPDWLVPDDFKKGGYYDQLPAGGGGYGGSDKYAWPGGVTLPDGTTIPFGGGGGGGGYPGYPGGGGYPGAPAGGGAPGGGHVVQPGDTLAGIADQYGISFQELMDANPQYWQQYLNNQGVVIINPGDTINLPGGGSYGNDALGLEGFGGAALNPQDVAGQLFGGGIGPDGLPLAPGEMPLEGGGQYEVQPGDNLSKIAAENGLTLQELMDANPDLWNAGPGMLKDAQGNTIPDLIQPGWMINIPGAAGQGGGSYGNDALGLPDYGGYGGYGGGGDFYGGGGGGGGAGAGGKKTVPAEPQAADWMDKLNELVAKGAGKIYEMDTTIQSVLQGMGGQSWPQFLSLLQALGFTPIGDIGPDNFPTDYIVPDNLSLTPEALDMLQGLPPEVQLAFNVILNKNLGLGG